MGNSLAEVQALLFGHHNGRMADDLVAQLVTLLVDGDHRAALLPVRGGTRKQNALPTVPIFWTFVILHLLIRKGQLYSRTSALKPMLEM